MKKQKGENLVCLNTLLCSHVYNPAERIGWRGWKLPHLGGRASNNCPAARPMRGLSGCGLSGAVNLVERQGEYETRFEVLGNSHSFACLKPPPTKICNFYFFIFPREKKKIQDNYHSFAPCPPFGNLALQSQKIGVSSINDLRISRRVNLDDRSLRLGIDGHAVHLQLSFLLRGKLDFVRDHSDPLELYLDDITVFEPHLRLAAHANARWSVTMLERLAPLPPLVCTTWAPRTEATRSGKDRERR